ncbi:MAG: hypothetical protein MZW92_58780 [Comamonadaceae bacterium]|nr:hypothetical protein [Comamonadaceae bacterium]
MTACAALSVSGTKSGSWKIAAFPLQRELRLHELEREVADDLVIAESLDDADVVQIGLAKEVAAWVVAAVRHAPQRFGPLRKESCRRAGRLVVFAITGEGRLLAQELQERRKEDRVHRVLVQQ